MASFYCNSIFLFKLVDQSGATLDCEAASVVVAGIKPCTHRVVHVNALQRIRVLLVTSLAALLHHGVPFSLVLRCQASGRIYLALRHELDVVARHAMYGGYSGAPFTVYCMCEII